MSTEKKNSNFQFNAAVSLSVYYQDGNLFATCALVEAASAYTIIVKDESGQHVYSKTWNAIDFVPPVQLSGPEFLPKLGKTYQITAVVSGPESEPASISPVAIAKAVLSVTSNKDTAQFSWGLLSNATSYEFNIAKAADPEVRVYDNLNLSSSAIQVGEKEGLAIGQPYIARIRGKADFSYGSWSDVLTFELNPAKSILQELKARLIAHQPDENTVVLNAVTLPEGTGNPAAILQLIHTNLAVDELRIKYTQIPSYADDEISLILDGTADWNGIKVEVKSRFSVDESYMLTLTLQMTLPEQWKFSDSFPSLDFSELNFLQLSEKELLLSSYIHQSPARFIPYSIGLNFFSTYLYTPDFSPAQETYHRLSIGGSILRKEAGVEISLRSENALSDITVKLTGLPTLTFTQGTLSISSTAAEQQMNNDVLVFDGFIEQFGHQIAYQLSVPTYQAKQLTLKLKQSSSVYELSTVLAGTAGHVLDGLLPLTLLQLAKLQLSNLEYHTSTVLDEPTQASVALSEGETASYELIPGLVLLSKLKLGVNVVHMKNGSELDSIWSADIYGQFTFGTLPVEVSVFIPMYRDWVLSLRPLNHATASLDNVATFSGASQQAILAATPTFFQQLTGFTVEEIKIGAAIMPAQDYKEQFSPHLSFIEFNLRQNTPWEIMGDVLCLSDWTLKTKLAKVAGNWQTSGVLSGLLKLGKAGQGASFEIEMQVPIGESGWRIALAAEGFDLPGIGVLLRMVGADRMANFLPKGIQTFGQAHISVFEVYFNPLESPLVRKLSFQMNTSEPWKLIENKGLEIKAVEVGMTLVNQSSAPYVLGFIRGTLTIAGADFIVNAGRTEKDEPWIFQTRTIDVVHLPGLHQLADWMLPNAVSQYIPKQLMPFGDGLDVTAAGFEFDLTVNTLNHVFFSITNREKWQLITDFINIDKAVVNAKIDRPLENDPGLTLQVGATLELGSLRLLLAAEKAAPDADWIFRAELMEAAILNFDEALKSLSMNLALAYSLGFPRELILETASATANATQGSFEMNANSLFDWNFNFGFATLSIKSLGLLLKIDALPAPVEGEPAPLRTYYCLVNGTLLIGNLQADIMYLTGNHIQDKTILTATLKPAALKNTSIDSFVDTLSFKEGNDNQWEQTKPIEYGTPVFDKACLYLNLSDHIGFLYGSITNMGSAAVMIKKIDEEHWGYAFGLNLGQHFKFGSILNALSVIDTFLIIKDAGLFIVSYEGSASSVIQDLQQINNLPDQPADFVNPVSIPDLGNISLSKGMLLYGHLEINTSPLFSKLLEIGTNGMASVVISAMIDHVNSVNSTFIADLPDIKVLNTIVFTHTEDYPGIHLQYFPNKNNAFSLFARLRIDAIFGKNYAFDGSLLVSEDNLMATLVLVSGSTDNQIVQPFGLPGLIIRELKAAVTYTFAKANVPDKAETSSRFSINGAVKIGRPPAEGTPDQRADLNMELCLSGSNPVLARVTLNETLSVGAFFAQFLTGDGSNWPSEFIEISFNADSKIYYYDQANDVGQLYHQPTKAEPQLSYVDGFNIQATIVLRILVDIPIAFSLHVHKNDKGKFNGVIASGSILKEPINLYILQIAGKTMLEGKYIGPPVFTLDTTGEALVMGFAAGFNFFQKPFGTTDLKIRSLGKEKELQLIGKLASAQKFEPFGVLSLDFTYSKSEGFKITNWPLFDFLQEAINFVETLKELASAGTGPCGKMAGFIIDQAYKTKFSITPGFETKSDGLYFVLNGKYTLSAMGHEFLTANFPKALQFYLPQDLSMDALPGEIFKSLSGAAKLFVESMLDHPEEIAKFLVIVAGENAARYAADLICDGLVDVTVAGAVEAGTVALAEAGGIAAGAAAILVLTNVIADAVKDATGKPDKVTNPEPPKGLALTYSDGHIAVTWKSVDFAAGYEVAFFNEKQECLKRGTAQYSRTVSCPIGSALPDSKFIVKVASLRGTFKSAFAESSISRWERPSNVVIKALNAQRQLQASWTGNAPKYEVKLYQDNTFALSVVVDQPFVSINPTNFSPANYHVSVSSLGKDNTKIPSLPSQDSNTVAILPNPTAITIGYVPELNAVLVTTVAVMGATAFQLKLVHESGQVLTEISALPDAGGALVQNIALQDLVVPTGAYHVAVSATGDEQHLSTLFVDSAASISKPGNPTGVSMAAAPAVSVIVVSWDNQEQVLHYEVQLFNNEADKPLKVYPVEMADTKDRREYTLDVNSFMTTAGATFIAKVALLGNAKMMSSDAVASAVSIPQLPAPTALLADWSAIDETISLSWESTDNPSAYEIELLEEASQKMSFIESVPGTARQYTFKMSKVSWRFNGNYQLWLRGMGDALRLNTLHVGSNVMHISTVDAPVLSINGADLNISWKALADAGYTYELEISNAKSGKPLTPQPPIQLLLEGGKIAVSAIGYDQFIYARIRQVKPSQVQVLTNGDGADGLNNWTLKDNGGNRWAIEKGPGASCEVTEGDTNFVTSYQWDTKYQLIDLLAMGLSPTDLDLSPAIHVSDWISSRFDSLGIYSLTVHLMDQDKNVIAAFNSGTIDAPIASKAQPWNKIAHSFLNYGKGLRFIYFYHGGRDKKNWAGHYGSKMTGARVLIQFKDSTPQGAWSAFSNVVHTMLDPNIPTVVRIPTDTPIQVPEHLKKIALIDPEKTDNSKDYPVIQWKKITFWPLSFVNNFDSMALMVYDDQGKMVGGNYYQGARYIYDIILVPEKEVILVGQSSKKITIPWKEVFK